MNVRKIVGKCLMGIGLSLMFVGTVSVPSTSSAAVGVVAPCTSACNKCGTPQRQDDGTYKCLKKTGSVVENGSCDDVSITCTGCASTCSEVKFEGEYSCACDL
jgi:hypothetical protein